MKRGTVIILQAVVANTPAEASCESPPNLVVNRGVVEAEGIADCRTIIARTKGGSQPNKPVTNNATAGTTISLHRITRIMGFL